MAHVERAGQSSRRQMSALSWYSPLALAGTMGMLDRHRYSLALAADAILWRAVVSKGGMRVFWMAASLTAVTRLCISLALARDADLRAAVVCKGGMWMSLLSRPLAKLSIPMNVAPLSVVRSGFAISTEAVERAQWLMPLKLSREQSARSVTTGPLGMRT